MENAKQKAIEKAYGENIKYIILNLKKKLLVVELPYNATKWSVEFMPETEECNLQSENILIFDSLDFISIGESTSKFICKGLDITEEIAENIVEKFTEESGRFKDYQRSACAYETALESLKSAIEANGYYFIENPIPEPELQGDETFCDYDEAWVKEWQEYEEKTFKNPLIFEIL